jgi:hypothetical protein
MIRNVELVVTSRVMWSPPPYLPSHLWPPQDLHYSVLHVTTTAFPHKPIYQARRTRRKNLMQTPFRWLVQSWNKRNRDVILGEVVQYLFFCHFNICDLKTGTETCLAQRKERGFRVKSWNLKDLGFSGLVACQTINWSHTLIFNTCKLQYPPARKYPTSLIWFELRWLLLGPQIFAPLPCIKRF